MNRPQTKRLQNVSAARRYDKGMATTTLMSFADFERLDFGADQVELLKGELIRLPPPYLRHMMICHELFKALEAAVEWLRHGKPGFPLGKVFMEMGYRFATEPTSWLRPDVSLTHPDQPSGNFYLGAPLIAFEVASEYDRAPDLHAKVAEYLANGAVEVWIVYPKQRDAMVHDGSGTARREARAITTPLLPGVEIPLDQIL
jgi:Uma2 family endonuclease